VAGSLTTPQSRLFIGAILISFSPVFVHLVDVSPTTSGFYRVLIGGSALAAFMLLTGRRIRFARGVWLVLCAASILFALDLWFWHRSIRYIGPGLSTLLSNLQVFFMMAGGAIFLRQRPTRIQLVAIPLALAGLTLIVGPDWQAVTPGFRTGVIFALLTAASYAGFMLCLGAARADAEHAVPLREVTVVSFIVTVLLGASALVEGESLAIPTYIDGFWLLAYGLLPHAVGWLFIASSLTKVTATEVGIALLLQPSLSSIWDIVFFGREVSPVEAFGAVVTLSAIYLGSRQRRPTVPDA